MRPTVATRTHLGHYLKKPHAKQKKMMDRIHRAQPGPSAGSDDVDVVDTWSSAARPG